MQPHIFVTDTNKENGEEEEEGVVGAPGHNTLGLKVNINEPKRDNRRTGDGGLQVGQGDQGGARGATQLHVPTFETTRRPSFLPNDTQMSLRPKVRKMSTYDLSLNESSINTGSLDTEIKIEGQTDELVDAEPPPCLRGVLNWLTGDVQYLSDLLDHWPVCSFLLPLRILNAILRTLGAPLLVNNPFSGALILAALMIENTLVTLWGLAALVIAMLTAILLHQPQHIVSSGQVTQHALLLGLLVGKVMHGQGQDHARGQLEGHTTWPLASSAVIVAVTSAVSVFTGNAVSTLLSQTNLPGLTVSYILIGTPLCASLGFRDIPEAPGVPTAVPAAPPGPPGTAVPVPVTSTTAAVFTLATNLTVTPGGRPRRLQWSTVLQGVVRGAGQVYGCQGLVSSSLILAALLVFSPTAFTQAILGTTTGVLFGALLDEPPYTALYAGLYGRHSLLTAVSLGGFFFVLNFYSTLAGVFAGVLATVLYRALLKSSLAVLTTPHVIATLVFLHARLQGGLLKRVDLIYITFPEMHRRLFRPGNAVEDCVFP